jgi:hypothetical protein
LRDAGRNTTFGGGGQILWKTTFLSNPDFLLAKALKTSQKGNRTRLTA